VARTIYLTGVGPGGGKSVVALGVTELLTRRLRRIGVFRPLVRTDPDPVLELLRHRYQLAAHGHGPSYAHAAGRYGGGHGEDLVAEVLDAYREVERGCDAIVVVGTDFGRGGADPYDSGGLPEELAFNARLATEMGAVVLPVVDAHERGAAEVADEVRGAYHALGDLKATVAGVLANRVDADRREAVLDAAADLAVPVYAIPDVPGVAAPTVAEVAGALGARRQLDGVGDYSRDVLDFVVGGATVPTFLDYLRDGALVITPGDRADLVIAACAAHKAGQVSLAGLVLTLGEVLDPRVLRLVRAMDTRLPVVSVASDSFDTVARVAGLQGRLGPDTPHKVEAAVGAFEAYVDTAALADQLDLARSTRVTPLMFSNELISRARATHRTVVLPEGTEERILRAADILLRRDVCDLVLLGPPDEVGRRARELGLDLSAAEVVDPATSPWRDDFAAEYARLRAGRGVTLDAAHDTVADVNYFGTLMVHSGRADAMVSGAAHPTADTIRPAFEIIRTVPGVSVASSVFFMCLPDRVLVYGDCAVNPEPTPRQLADIALSSADTAARFGIPPRVAMLSYSTGTSGRGADVDRVKEATELVRAARPDLPVEGPIQYDAAVDPDVAAAKLPGSRVAGQATVFVFPDLNTGNNTYKAVQRSANAVAVGPVMQGLRRPVNDLSRGATVADIVNTVAITAIQAGDR
jgi:phosphate acetyltransferase